MTKFGDWIRERYVPMHDREYDLANLTAQLEEATDCKRGRRGSCVNYKNFPKDQWCDGCLALAACKEFQEKYNHD